MSDTAQSLPAAGMTVPEVARLLRLGPDRVRGMIRRRELGAIELRDSRGRPRWIVLPDALAEFARRHQAGEPPRPARRRRQAVHDYYSDD